MNTTVRSLNTERSRNMEAWRSYKQNEENTDETWTRKVSAHVLELVHVYRMFGVLVLLLVHLY